MPFLTEIPVASPTATYTSYEEPSGEYQSNDINKKIKNTISHNFWPFVFIHTFTHYNAVASFCNAVTVKGIQKKIESLHVP